MKVSKLKALLANVPDDTEVVIGGGDHSYLAADASLTQAEAFRPNPRRSSVTKLLEYFGHENKNDPDSEVVTVLVIF